MKHTTHRCDFCGGAKKTADLGTLTMPMSDEEAALLRRCNPIQDEMHTYRMLSIGIVFGDVATTTQPRTYDICRDCASGLVRARFATLAKLREAFGVEAVPERER